MRRGAVWAMLLGAGLVLWLGGARELTAARVSDVRSTKHNLSISGPGTVKAVSESQVCVFCHTPHGAEDIPAAPLWNRKASTATYMPYSSSSIEANVAEMAAAPGGSSKLCLSCHDGTLALGNVNVLNGSGPAAIALSGTAGGGMPAGAGAATGFTRNLGVDLGNDHPISFTYDASLAAADGELRVPDGTSVGPRLAGVRPVPRLPLDNGQMQCATCHDPHLHENDPAMQPGKFLRANRLQALAPTGSTFSEADDQICLACHDKAGQSWAQSAHANPAVADEQYKDAAATQREFPQNLPVWQAGCLNCHDTHSVQGARRLLREGTDSLATPKSGGNPAIEETCYQCHRDAAGSILKTVSAVPNIRDDYVLLTRRMPITNAEQGDVEAHDIGTLNADASTQRGKDFIESRAKLGHGNLANRHAECSDCHNPHRVIRNRLFNATGDATEGTHVPGSNLASGVLRGTWGVEPNYGAASFRSLPSSYAVKRGDPGGDSSTLKAAPFVTREYQICLKCHSDYGYLDDGFFPSATRPNLGPPGTPAGTNAMTQYTNQAMEFQAPSSHRANQATTDSDAFAGDPPGPVTSVNFQQDNRRSWHPVIDDTGRTHALRNTSPASFLAPWQLNVGSQTMYCTDCHGSSTAPSSIVPDTPAGGRQNPWGPHGSDNDFILKGRWSQNTGAGISLGVSPDANALCFKCHDATTYSGNIDSGGGSTGFFNPDSDRGKGNLHQYHREKIGRIRCTWCHIAVPHGWKNKMFLVNLNDVGPEAGLPRGTQVRNNTRNIGYTNGPYYLNAMLKIRTFAPSGAWLENSCGSVGAPGNGTQGKEWMRDSTESCNNPP